jgi:hypothetical protein
MAKGLAARARSAATSQAPRCAVKVAAQPLPCSAQWRWPLLQIEAQQHPRVLASTTGQPSTLRPHGCLGPHPLHRPKAAAHPTDSRPLRTSRRFLFGSLRLPMLLRPSLPTKDGVHGGAATDSLHRLRLQQAVPRCARRQLRRARPVASALARCASAALSTEQHNALQVRERVCTAVQHLMNSCGFSA